MGISVISKAELRKQILEQRKSLAEQETAVWDERVLEQIKKMKLEERTDTVYCYISVRGETGTQSLIRHFLDCGLKVAVPRVKGKTMDFYYIKSYEDLEPGGFGIPEPKKDCVTAVNKTAPVIVPGVAFSRRFERTGYGAGYYDRYFEQQPEHEKIAICYDFQLADVIAVEPHDILMDRVITPSENLIREDD